MKTIIIDRASDEQIDRAAKAGKAAFHKGNVGIPSQDATLRGIIGELFGLPLGSSTPVIDAWYRGYKRESLRSFIATCPQA